MWKDVQDSGRDSLEGNGRAIYLKPSSKKLKKKLNSVACSPQANYTDQAAAAC
jgi:hypothetical protein